MDGGASGAAPVGLLRRGASAHASAVTVSEICGGRDIRQLVRLTRNLSILTVGEVLARSLTFVAFARFTGHLDGQVYVFLVTAVAAAEAAIGLAIFVSLFRLHRSINVDQMNAMGD